MGAEMTEQTDVPDITPSGALPEATEDTSETTETGYRYIGPDERTYPLHRHPVTGETLVVQPGDLFDFGELMPPGDGLWYDVSSGEPYTDSPASTGAGETEE
jgi:hypothetical protein